MTCDVCCIPSSGFGCAAYYFWVLKCHGLSKSRWAVT